MKYEQVKEIAKSLNCAPEEIANGVILNNRTGYRDESLNEELIELYNDCIKNGMRIHSCGFFQIKYECYMCRKRKEISL